MKKSILFRSNTLFLILLLFLLSLNLFAEQHNTVSVSGKVKNATTYAGILHAKILLEGDNSYETYSDQNGNFSFDNVVPTSVYTLIVRKSSYEEFSQSINVDTNNVNLRNISLFKSPENPEVYIGNLDYTEDLYNFPFEWHSAEKYTQTLYFKEEINNEYYMGGDTPITSIKYRYNSSMSDQLTFPVKIWMANREETEFTQGDSYYYFFFPVTESKLVWEGEVVIQPGSDNELEIVLDQPFYYTGNSLLISIYHSQIHTSDYYIYFKGTNPPSSNVRTVHSGEYSSAAVNVYYPGYGYFDNRYINTQLTFGTAGYASVFGVVTNNNELVTDAKISIQGTDRFVTTDSNGRYQLDYIEPGLTTLIASYENYNDTLYEDLELTADSSQEYNFELSPQTTITISGQVNDSLTGQGIENAKILISGYEDYEAITNSSGAFTFTNISSGQAYDIKVLKTNYEISSIQIQAENDDIALGTINLVHGSNIIEQFIGNPESVLAKHLYPVNLSYKYSLTQTYYMPEEISSEYHFGEGSLITSLSYYIDTDGVLVEPYAMKVWLANATSFTPNGFALWVPMEEFTLVFDGTIDLSNAGTYPVEIEFSEPFEYEGNELIVMVKKNDLNQYIGNGKIDWVRTYTPYYNGRTHFYGTNQQDLEPEGYYGDKTSFVPNTKFNFITSDYSSINGTITQNGSPIENVKVALDGTNRYTF
ncbi:MAG: carboxypeptidase-like regulatory domain-containing protein, partial [Candidatus Cloacimonetes bacterium]|nr:carboxypeptidase-like regulatory domain-containing protein [Candidatus Cloacimonadota bacterium]